LAIALAFASIALPLHFGAEGNGLTQVLTVTRHRIISTVKLSAGHACACVALISVECRSDIDGSAVVLASAGVVGAFDLSCLFTCTRITVSQDNFPELHDSAHVLTVTRVVGAADCARRLANASVATVWNSRTNGQIPAVVRATAGHGL